jgi:AraC-like DNA-binding protein
MMEEPYSFTSVHPYPREGGEIEVLFAGESQTEPEHRMGPQVLDYYLVHTVMEGEGTFRLRHRDYSVKAGDSFFIFPGELHTYQSHAEKPWFYRWVAFRGRQAERWLSAASITPERPVVSGGDPFLYEAAQAIERSFREKGWTADWEAQGWLRLAMAAWAKAHAPDGPPARSHVRMAAREADRAARWMDAQLAGPVTIADLAKEMGYHRTHLTKLFRREKGMSPVRYLQLRRMERARLLLREPLTVEEVASSVGYADPLYFSKVFKKWSGVSPTAFRQHSNEEP